MANDNVVEYLVKGDTSSAIRGFADLEAVFGKLSGVVAGLSVGLAALKFGELVSEQYRVADEINKLAQRTGVATEAFSTLSHTFEMDEVSSTDLAQSFRFLNKHIETATSGNEAAAASFASVGVSFDDLKTKSPDEVMVKMSDAFNKTADGAGKSTAAVEFFGRAGTRMIPILNQGSAAIKEQQKWAKEHGLQISEKFGKDSDAFLDKLQLMSKSVTGHARILAEELLPILNEVVDALISVSETGEPLVNWGKIVATAVGVVALTFLGLKAVIEEVVIWVTGSFRAVGIIIGGVAAAIGLVLERDVAGAGRAIKLAWEDAAQEGNKTLAAMDKAADSNATHLRAVADAVDNYGQKFVDMGPPAALAVKNLMSITTQTAHDAQVALLKKQNDYLSALAKMEAAASQSKIAVIDAEYKAQQTKMDELKLTKEQRAQAEVLLEQWKSEQIEQVQAEMVSKLGAGSELWLTMKRTEIDKEVALMREAGMLKEDITRFQEESLRAIEVDSITQRQAARVTDLDHQMQLAQTSGEVASLALQSWAAGIQSWQIQIGTAIGSTMNMVVDGISNAVARSIVLGESLSAALKSVMQNVAMAVVSALVKIGVQMIATWLISKFVNTATATSEMARGLAAVYVNSFASAAAIPFIGWAIAPGVAAGNTAIAVGGIAAAGATGAGLGLAIGGAAHGGLTEVPSEQTYLLQRGERVVSPNQNADLKEFMNSGSPGGSVQIGVLKISILENATNADSLLRMSDEEMRDVISRKIIPALNVLDRRGTRPDFAQRGRSGT